MSYIENNCKWHFAVFSGGREDGPNEPMQENFKKTPYASLIRESIQNSLDVCLDDSKPVEMEFKISSISTKNYPNFFDLSRHVKGCLEHFKGNENAKQVYESMLGYLKESSALGNKMYYIKVSDYNTKGMNYIPDDRTNSFYAFVRAAGVSAKSDASAGGSFGYGKAAYFYMSAIRTIIISTQTDDGKYFFEGVSSLCTHSVDGEKLVAVGYYDNNDGNPVEDYESIPTRFRRKDSEGNDVGPGTDINIMGIDLSNISKNEIYEEMMKALLRNFWLAIYDNKLVVTIGDTLVNKENLSEIMGLYFPDEHDTSKKIDNYNPRPYLETVLRVGENKNHVLFECDLNNHPDFADFKKSNDCGKLLFYAWKTKNANNRIIYMRKPRMLVYGQRNYSGNGYYGVFLCTGGWSNEQLRKTENPAHNEWNIKNIGSDFSKKDIKFLVEVYSKFVDECIKQLFDYANSETLSIKGLDQYLYIPTDVETEEDDEQSNETLIGNPTDIIKDEGSSSTSVLSQLIKSPINKTEAQQGRVMVNQTNTAKQNSSGKLLSGKSDKKIKQKGGGVGSHNPNQKNQLDNEGISGSYLEIIPIQYRTFALTMNGLLFHKIIIHSDYNVEKGEVQILVGGDDSINRINVVASSSGVVSGNVITNIKLSKGRNEFYVRFADKMKHSIKVEAYEVK